MTITDNDNRIYYILADRISLDLITRFSTTYSPFRHVKYHEQVIYKILNIRPSHLRRSAAQSKGSSIGTIRSTQQGTALYPGG